MSTPYVGEIRIVGFNFAPNGWAFCNGQSLAISEFDTLFNLIGTTYGGDGVNTFNLPNLQGRIPFHQGTDSQGDTLVIGQSSGTESVLLTQSQLPVHTHVLAANSATGTQPSPAGGLWAASTLEEFSTEAPTHSMVPSTTLSSGGSQPHDNLPPFQVLNFVISLFGVFPSQN
jgi:microcystin-dependent protein